MKPYWLQSKGMRDMIDDNLHDGFESVSRVLASSWLHAKELLGFTLTPLQTEIRWKQINGK